ncbi:MAG: 23S rRNA (cytidine1920-2'-O)/16S rRNA (cytidine1409-2'-O)-methyltransferase [Myxococcota bacterium]
MSKPARLDQLLVKRGLAASRQRAQELITGGHVLVDGIPVTKSAARVKDDKPIRLAKTDFQWVGRGALKMLAALQSFPTVDPTGMTAADLGSSTGGFTEVLLHKGTVRVYAIDVGTNQLDWRLRSDDRVVVMEGTNARHVQSLPEPIDLIVGDLSFISLSLILPTVARLLRPGGQAVILVKPQFEVGREHIERGGKVSDAGARTAAIDGIAAVAEGLGLTVLGGADCAVPGARAGNVEHFLHLQKSPVA